METISGLQKLTFRSGLGFELTGGSFRQKKKSTDVQMYSCRTHRISQSANQSVRPPSHRREVPTPDQTATLRTADRAGRSVSGQGGMLGRGMGVWMASLPSPPPLVAFGGSGGAGGGVVLGLGRGMGVWMASPPSSSPMAVFGGTSTDGGMLGVSLPFSFDDAAVEGAGVEPPPPPPPPPHPPPLPPPLPLPLPLLPLPPLPPPRTGGCKVSFSSSGRLLKGVACSGSGRVGVVPEP